MSWQRARAVRLYGDVEPFFSQSGNKLLIHLQKRLAAGEHHEPVPLSWEQPDRLLNDRGSFHPLAAPELGIAELADSLGTILLTTRPQIAAGEAHEHRDAPDVGALALRGQE